MFHKDTFRLIKKTFNRFFSLVMIVIIAVLLITESIFGKDVEN